MAAIIYLIAAGGLALLGGLGEREEPAESFADFEALKTLDYSGLPEIRQFAARDGAMLGYRAYPGGSERALIMLHGSGYHGKQLHPFAKAIGGYGGATVYVPDIRGHGASASPRGDIDHVDQLVEDIADLMTVIRRDMPSAKVFLGGHSSGGGLAVRAVGDGLDLDGVVLLAPYLGHDVPTTRPNSGGWARPYLARIIGLSMLNQVGIPFLNGLTAIDFSMPETVRDGSETLSYSYRLMVGFAPRDFRKDLEKMDSRLLVLVGSKDDAFFPDRYADAMPPAIDAKVEILDGLTHLGVAYSPVTAGRVLQWLKGSAE